MFAFISTNRSPGKRRRMSIWVAAVGILLTVAATLAMVKRDRSLEKQRFAALAGDQINAVREELQRPIQLVNLVHDTMPTHAWGQAETMAYLGEQLQWQTPAVTALAVITQPAPQSLGDRRELTDRQITAWQADENRSANELDRQWDEACRKLEQEQLEDLASGNTENLWSVLRLQGAHDSSSMSADGRLLVWRPILIRDSANNRSRQGKSSRVPAIGWIVLEIDTKIAASNALERLTAIPLNINFQSRQADVSLPRNARAATASAANSSSSKDWSLTKSLSFADEQWRVVAEAPADVWKNNHQHMPWFFLVAGLFATAALTAYIASITGQAQRIETQVQRQTAELREANAQLKREVATRRRVEERISDYAMDLEKTNQHLEEARSEMEQTLIELKERNRELDEFNYVASHDLQEPVRKLISFSTLLKQDLGSDLCETAQQDLFYIVDAAHRMKQLISDLLAFSRSGREAMRREPVDLNECLQSAIDALFLAIEESSAEIRRDELPTVIGDRTMLTQLFQNLIGNSIKFCEEQSPLIEITAESHGDSCTIRVKDNGIGIRAKYCERIFLPFQRLHGSTKFAGNGIGLAICRKTVSRHSGRIWVESELGHGAKFYFTLPTAGSPATLANKPSDSSDLYAAEQHDDEKYALLTSGSRASD